MRVASCSLTLLLLAAFVFGQAKSDECDLQQLAIDAALGEVQAQYNLGVEFFRGTCVPRDYAKAANLWRKASDAGHAGASNNFGFLIYNGRPGVQRDYAEGIRRWRFAAERGFAESQVHLAEAYLDAKFLPIDLIEAYAWATAGKHNSSRSSAGFDKPDLADAVAQMADDVLGDIGKKLTVDEKAKAEKKAAEYIRKFAPQ
ncbi:MAG TPA: tetratricopeptide repeat protein [Pyrinomonadaceae bacterium]